MRKFVVCMKARSSAGRSYDLVPLGIYEVEPNMPLVANHIWLCGHLFHYDAGRFQPIDLNGLPDEIVAALSENARINRRGNECLKSNAEN